MKKIILILLFAFFFYAESSYGISSSISVSETDVIANRGTVRFTCDVIPDPGENIKTITFDIDYEADNVIDTVKTLTLAVSGPATHTFYHVFPEAGYWDTEVGITVNEGSREVLTSATVNVAAWRFPDIDSAEKIGGIESSPAVGAGGVIYFGAEDKSLYAVNADGTLKWSFPTDGPVSSAPVVDNSENIYFGSKDGSLYCLLPAGTEKWRQPFSSSDDTKIYSISGSPALNRDATTVYIGTSDGSLYAVNALTGDIKNSFPTAAKIVATPAVAHDGTVYIGSLDNYLYALTPDLRLRWKINLGSEIYGGMTLDADGTIYMGTARHGGTKDSTNQFYALSPAGQIKWQTGVLSGFAASPVMDAKGSILAGSWDNRLYAFNRDGKALWQFKASKNDILSAAAVGSNDLIYTACGDGKIYALIDEYNYFTGREIAWQYDMKLPVTTASPVVVNGRVYVATYTLEEGALWAFATESKEMAHKLNYAITEAHPNSPWPLMQNDIQNSGRTGFKADTIALAVLRTDPANGLMDFDVSRSSITATFSTPVDPDLLYLPPSETPDGFYGFTVEPFEEEPEAFEIRWISDRQVELVLPAEVSFKKDVAYTATLQTREPGAGAEDDRKRLLGPHRWVFKYETPEDISYSGDRGCFISCLRFSAF